MTPEAFHALIEESTGNESNICGISAIRDGRTVYEDAWHGCRITDAWNVMSVTKGVMALLTGIAVDKGLIRSTEQKVLDFFPDYPVKRGEKTIYDVTLRHLLTMTAPYKYRSEPWTQVCTSPDWTKAALDLLGGRAGVTGEFKYSTLGIQILSGIIESASGMKCIDFANRFLFEPLGIPPRRLHGPSSKEDQLSFLMNKTPRDHEWYSDPRGSVTAGWGLALSARDLAVIGDMCLHWGAYGGRQVVSEAWVREMTAPYIGLDRSFGYMSYGYLWYRPFRDRPVFAAIGDGGNIIYADPERKISVGITGTFRPRVFDRIRLIENWIIPILPEA